MKKIAIIGAGASGLVAGITVARNRSKVVIFEKSYKEGKKILASGNGRCNITNEKISTQNYHGKYPHFAKDAIKFDAKKFFNGLGVELKNKKGTRLYPMSDQASIVLEALLFECKRLGVEIVKECKITKITPQKDGYMINDTLFDCVIIACGSSAMPHISGSESGYDLALSLGHKIERVFASLVQLVSSDDTFFKASGVRVIADLELLVEGVSKMKVKDDLLFTNYGLSGSGILDLSRSASFALNKGSWVVIKIDLIPNLDQAKLKSLLKKRLELKLPLDLWLGGIINKKLINPILNYANIKREQALNIKSINTLAYTLKNLEINIVDTKGYKKAEVMAGGVDTSQVDSKTMESKLHKGLYFCGEVLDIDGDCGGYNLHFAWGSGYLAGKSASGN